MKIRERDEARTLRREQGQSIKEIARAVGVSCSSVSLWVRDIELTPAQIEALAAPEPGA
jgi:transcriptional regulator with XRE-family HTH domain